MLNPQAEAFVPATPLRRKASSTHPAESTFADSPISLAQPATPTISSQALFDDYSGDEPWHALQNYLHDGDVDSEATTDSENGIFAMPRDTSRSSFSSFSKSMDRCNPRSAILMWRNKHEGSKASKAVHYLPLESTSATPGFPPDLRVQANRVPRTNSSKVSMPPTHRWPPGRVPVELFELVADSLARDDVMAMRLVNHEFEDKVSRVLFHTCVVPFNTELYDMIDDYAKCNTRTTAGKLSPPSIDQGGLQWLNAKEDADGKLYKGHGLRVFQGFGPHIKRFGMSFEVTEDQLSHPPVKKALDAVDSYHGLYKWPPAFYTRFANVAGLERTADETSRMKAAFSNLKGVRELALSIDSGLGWLAGPDQSVRARILKHSPLIFSSAQRLPSQQLEAARLFWDSMQQSQQSVALQHDDPWEVVLAYRPLLKTVDNILGESRYVDTHEWPMVDNDRVTPDGQPEDFNMEDDNLGLLYTTPGTKEGLISFNGSVLPSELRRDQKEWLLEMDWAQRAFLESYMLAVVDNRRIFEHVTTLNIAKLSSRFIRSLASVSFWAALPFLEDVTLLVCPEWRFVEKDEAGVATTSPQHPSSAVDLFHNAVLRPRISNHPTIKKLKIGWVGGGEHAEGMYARNNHILPAPITLREYSLVDNTTRCMQFQNIEHLILVNCWMSPPTLEGLLQVHADKRLRKLTLDSVSLTAHPSVASQAAAGPAVPAVGGANAGQLPNQPGFMHNILLMPAPGPVQAGVPPVAAGPGNVMNLPAARQRRATLQHGRATAGDLAVHMAPAGQPIPNPQQQAWWLGNIGAWPIQGIQLPVPPQLPPSHFTADHRSGSWADILNRYSPGVILSDYLPRPEAWEDPLPPRPIARLQTLDFNSCGYLLLNARQSFDQTAIEGDWTQQHMLSTWFRHRATSLRPLMMDSSDTWMGRISQYMPQHEQEALQLAWGLTPGWQENGDAPAWDGLRLGGVGRFSGVVYNGMSKMDGRKTMRGGD